MAPSRSAAARFWLSLRLPVSRSTRSETPTMPRSCPATNGAGASATDQGRGCAASRASVSRDTKSRSRSASSTISTGPSACTAS